MTKTACLDDRALLRLSGKDTVDFLQNLITCDVENLSPGEATFGALLTPQGKVLFDFFALRDEDGFLFDVAADQKDDFARRLTFYKLRADVQVTTVDDLSVFVSWNGETGFGFADPRLTELGRREYVSAADTTCEAVDWHAHRIDVGVPSSGDDFDLGDAFPHEVLMDQFATAGVDFKKGCYVGQEVVSRMQHRGTTRKRWIKIHANKAVPARGTPITAAGKTLGTIGSSVQKHGLAVVRLDRTKAAMDATETIEAEGIALTLSLPQFVDFGWPA